MSRTTGSPVIFFIHKSGIPDYLVGAILQARVSNPSAQICLLTDQHEASLPRSISGLVEVIDLESIGNSAAEFAGVFHYRGGNDYDYELFNFQRWLYAKSACESIGHDGPTVVLDSDALLYLEVGRVFRSMATDMTVVDQVGPQFAFFRNLSSLSGYVAFISSCFKKPDLYSKLESFVANYRDIGLPHVSDMASLGIFAQQEALDDIGNAARSDFVFCENIGSSQGLRTGNLGKRITKINRERYFIKLNGTKILAGGVHLQGGNKTLWPMYVQAKVLTRLFAHDPNLITGALQRMLKKITQIQLIKFAETVRRLRGVQ